MIPEFGHFLLWLALGLAIALGTVPMAGAALARPAWMALARPGSYALFGLVLASFICLVIAFVRHDFSVLYVASNSNSALPPEYRIAVVWGGHEGSLLLWLLMLTGWMMAVARFSRHLPQAVMARTLAVMGLVSVGFLLFTLTTSNPFERLFPVPADGRDLNPLLQDPGMVFHPPLLYMGYVGFSVAFAFAIAALIGGKLDASWARWMRPWTNIAWMFLTIGIGLPPNAGAAQYRARAAAMGFWMTFWIVGSVVTDLAGRVHPAGARLQDVPCRLGQLPRAVWGMVLAHLGVAVFCFGMVMVKTYEVERDVKMEPGDVLTLDGYSFTFRGAREISGPNYQAMQGLLEVTQDGKRLRDMLPEKRMHRVQQNPMTEPAIATGFTRDIYVALGESVGNSGGWVVRVYLKPFVDWIWGGCLIMAFGGLLAASDRRYAVKMRSEQAQTDLLAAGARA